MDATPQGRVVGGRYLLLEPIGRGGMGIVWTARDQLLDRIVAIKEVLPPAHLDQDERRAVQQRTLREARAAAGLSSVAAVTVHDVLDEDGLSWIVMERLEAPSLAEVLRDSGPLGVDEAIAVGLSLVDALQMAHGRGVLHRDVKPANVMLTRRGAVLTDFGIAHRDGDPGITTTGVVLGSPSYLAPERARGEPAGPLSDMWSVGATLYAAVQGRGPFDRDGQLATLHAVVSDPPPEPDRAGVLAPLLLRLLSKDPADRPTLERAREMLERARRGEAAGTAPLEPVPAQAATLAATPPAATRSASLPSTPPIATPPATTGTRRRRGRTVAVAGLVLLLLTALVVAVVTLLPGPGGGDDPTDDGTALTPPAPFESAALYEFARYLFDAEECFGPEPGDFPFADIEPDIELVKCEDQPYSGTFWCKDDLAGLRADRRVYLDNSVGGTQPVTGPPAGQDEPADGVQRAFVHGSGNGARVYWDSEALLCAGELQTDSYDVEETIDYWRSRQTS